MNTIESYDRVRRLRIKLDSSARVVVDIVSLDKIIAPLCQVDTVITTAAYICSALVVNATIDDLKITTFKVKAVSEPVLDL